APLPTFLVAGAVFDDRGAPGSRRVVHDGAATAAEVAGACPRRPEDHRENEADDADDHDDPADGLNVDPVGLRTHGERENCADRDEKNAYSDSHSVLLFACESAPDTRLRYL